MASNFFPWLILYLVTIFLFGLLEPNFIFNVGSSNPKCKAVGMPKADSSDCANISWKQWGLHLLIFSVLYAILLGVIYMMINKKFDELYKTASQYAQQAYSAAGDAYRKSLASAGAVGASIANAAKPLNPLPYVCPTSTSAMEMKTFN